MTNNSRTGRGSGAPRAPRRPIRAEQLNPDKLTIRHLGGAPGVDDASDPSEKRTTRWMDPRLLRAHGATAAQMSASEDSQNEKSTVRMSPQEIERKRDEMQRGADRESSARTADENHDAFKPTVKVVFDAGGAEKPTLHIGHFGRPIAQRETVKLWRRPSRPEGESTSPREFFEWALAHPWVYALYLGAAATFAVIAGLLTR